MKIITPPHRPLQSWPELCFLKDGIQPPPCSRPARLGTPGGTPWQLASLGRRMEGQAPGRAPSAAGCAPRPPLLCRPRVCNGPERTQFRSRPAEDPPPPSLAGWRRAERNSLSGLFDSIQAAVEEESNLALSRPGSFQAEIRAGRGGGKGKKGGVIALYFPPFNSERQPPLSGHLYA